MKRIYRHFNKIAAKYRDLRTTDIAPILIIKRKLKNMPKIIAADVGCGAGRYSLKLLQHLGKTYLFCVDANKYMLEQLRMHLIRHEIKNFDVKKAYAHKLPFKDKSLDCVFALNAIHHFKLGKFLEEVSRVLRNNGYLFIYSRLRSQNRRNIWGRYFPLFSKKETRLYKLAELKSILKCSKLKIESIEYFKYKRLATLEWLLEQAKNHHYSTFCLYTKKEFNTSLKEFQENILADFKNPNKINWYDENIMFTAKKCA